MPATWVVAGANLAGGRAAETLRQEGFDGRLVLIGAEPDRPYERPPLSKELLWGTRTRDAVYLRSPDYYASHEIELRLGVRATRLDPLARTLALDGGERLRYEKLLLATGASPRRLDVPGADLDGVLYLRTLAHSEELRRRMRVGRRVVVVGVGFIGAEVAASCRRAGLEVVALEALPSPLAQALGDRVSELYAGIHRDHGVDLRTSETVTGFRGSGRLEQVTTASGAAFDCDFAVVGVGAVPECSWLRDAGLALGDGVVVDELCRTTADGVYAAGDLASWWHPGIGRRLRVEHFDNAQLQGVAAAKSMLGKGEPYAPVPFFWSDQYDVTFQHVGYAGGEDEVVLRGSAGSGSWCAFYLRQGRLVAAFGANRFREIAAARQLIARRARVDARQLADESVDLRQLARQKSPGDAR
jgi:3-phenylpropionate/trans-cinnamate dioxygenase ferredoxin reductase subunit